MKNLINLNIEKLATPSKLPISFKIQDNQKITNPSDDDYIYHDRSKFRMYCKAVDGLLAKSVGKPFAEVYSKVCNEYPNTYCGAFSIKDYFNSQFIPKTYYYGVKLKYRIDDKGNIQLFSPERILRRPVSTNLPEVQEEYRVNKEELQNSGYILNQIFFNLGRNVYEKVINSDTIPEELYIRIKELVNCDFRLGILISKYKLKRTFRNWKSRLEWVKIEDLELKKRDVSPTISLEQNTVDRDRLGFNENSFRKKP